MIDANFYKLMLQAHDEVVSDMVNSALDQSDHYSDALNLIDDYEAGARNDHRHASEATDFIGLCQKARKQITRTALLQEVNHDD